MQKKFSIFFIGILLLQMISGSFHLPSTIQAVEAGESSFQIASIQDVEGNEINLNEAVGELLLKVDWAISSTNTKNVTYELPDEVQVTEKQEGLLISKEETEIGHFVVSEDNMVTARLHDSLSEDYTANGTIAFQVVGKAENAQDIAEEPEGDEQSPNEKEELPQEAESVSEADDDTEVVQENVANANKSNDIRAANDEKHGFRLELEEILDLDDEAFDKQHPMNPHKEFKVKLDWELEDDHNYVTGDKETFDLPKGIKINEDIEIELKDGAGQVVANAVVTPDKKVELTFTDYVETHSDVSGWMEVISELDIAEVEEEDGEIIIDPIGEEGELRIPIEKENKDKTIEKNGQPNKGYNADEINWTVIVNKNKTSLKDAKVTDVLPEGTEYKDGSLKVTKLRVDLDGGFLGDLEEVEIDPEIGEDGELIIPLGDTNDAYRVEYVTNVTDDKETSFKNKAIITDEDLNDVSADATLTINRGEPLKKGAVKDYDPKTGIIEWYLEFNYNQKDLNDVTLADKWTPSDKIELVDGSLKFQEVEIDENGKAQNVGEPIEPSTMGSYTKKNGGFEVSGITTDRAYYVVYQTKVKDRVIEDTLRMENIASFGEHTSNNAYNMDQQVGEKIAGNIDYTAKTIEWTIKVNMDHRPMNDIVIEDTIGEGLTLIDDSIKMTIDGQEKTDFNLENGNPFKLTNIGDTNQEIIVTYKTEFDADNVPDYIAKNKADISWILEGNSDRIKKDVSASTELNKETKDNSWKNGSYNPETKEITWEIITNYRENDIANLVIKDTPQGNQQIIDGSAEVKELNIAANGEITEGDTVDSVATIDVDANTLKVAIAETSKAYKITYKTSLVGLDDMQDEYVNEAEVFDGEESLSDIDAKVGIVQDSKYGDKSGYQDGKQIHWSIDVNFVQQKVQDLKLVDTISENQEYLEDSIKVYEAKIDSNGNASKGVELSSDAYALNIDQEAGEFTVEWNDEVERAFIVDYSTLFFAGHQENVDNSYKITGDSIATEESDANGSDTVTISQLGSGGGSGKAGYLVIDKVDSTYNQDETKLEGAEFDLIDPDTGKVLKSGTTDENGQIDFGRLLFGDYQLKETKVPEGYVTPEEVQTITIDKAYEPGNEKESFEYTVENYQPVFAIELSKTDDENNALKGAEFTLFDSNAEEIARETTNEDGKILFEDLKSAGTYYVQETKAPAGYVLDETKHVVEVGEKEQKPVTVTAENKARGKVQLTKKDQDTDEALKGVEFALQKENESGGYDTIETFTTNDNGQIATSNTLEAGNYQFVETKGLDGYRTNGNPVKFTVNINSTEDQEYTMENEQYKGSIELLKTNRATEQVLQGAEFKLVDSDGKVIKENLETNNEGKIVIDDLFLGDYQLIETKAPAGYELDETPIDIEITEDNQVIEKTMTNNKITDISVEKRWNNNDGDTKPVIIKLLPTEKTVELNEANNWKAAFEKLDVYDENNEAIEYKVEELAVDGYNSEVTGDASDGFIVTNTETTSVAGEKTWQDDESDERPDKITVKLLADGEKAGQKGVTAEDNWQYTFTNLDKYNQDGEAITYTIDEVEVDGYDTDIDGFDITNTRVGTIAVEGEKTWQDVDATDRPEEITVELSRAVDGKVDENFSENRTVKPDSKGNWTYAFTDLAEFNDEGVAYTYTVEESDIPGNYESSVEGYDITNTRTGKTEVSGTKRWKDDTLEDRPEKITVNLLRNNVVVDTKEVTADEDWKYTFAELDKYDDEGQLYKYAVKEQDVEGYHSNVNGTDITNTRSEKKDIEVNKAWLDDDSDERPQSIIVYLKQNGENFNTIELKAENDWKYEFTDLEAFDENGHAYSYSVEEKPVEGYETTIDGFDITNLRVGETEVSGTKTWLDDNSENRPEEITVNLLANGEETDQSSIVDADSDWTYEFTKLDKYDNQGKEIEYTVDEEAVEGYEKSIDGNNITNLRIGTTEVTGEKNWIEVDERYRPDSITVQLLANGEAEDTVEVSDEKDWSYGFTGLDKYDDQGKEIIYTVEELAVPAGYTVKVDSYDITNTQLSTEVTGEKVWEEVNSDYRPDTIIVQLLANGEKETTVEVSSDTDWKYEFTDLAKYDKSGVEIKYTVEEIDLPKGYESDIDGTTITNTQVAITILGEKVWNEVDNRYRPDAITVQLLANGEEEATVEVSAATDWEYEFKDLAKYDKAGNEIEYTIVEIDVPVGYESEVDGTTITNTQETTAVSGEKVWEEVNSEYRPDTITVQLLANGEKETRVEVSSDTDWKYEFTDLAKYDKSGEEIHYTVEEADVPKGYKSEVDEYTITNTQKSTEVSGTKTWLDNDSNDRPKTITVQVKVGDEVVDETEVTAKNDWTYTFTDLAKYDGNGEEINYTIDETLVDGYKKIIEGNDITNLRIGEMEVDVTKGWKDDSAENRPDTIKVNLLQNGQQYEEYEVTEENEWNLTISDLPQYDEEGKAYMYSITEHDVAGYASEVDGFDITNTRTDKKDIEITKTWLDDDDAKERPETIEVELFRSVEAGDNEFVETYELTTKAGWSITVGDLPVFDKDGKAYTYEVIEKAVEGYQTTISGFDITNLRIGTTEVEGTKTWKDNDTTDRPESIKVNLLADGVQVDSLEVTEETDWTYRFTALEAYDENGKEIDYTIEEEVVDGYETIINGYDITNTRTGVTHFSGIKTWLDDDAADRPASITVHLLANGAEVDSRAVTADEEGNWIYSFTDLAKYDENGVEINYAIEEANVAGYKTIIDGHHITNLRVGTTEVAGTKTWKNDTVADRPESIKVNLFANGVQVDSLDVTKETDWTYGFTGLEAYDENGKEIDYTIEEEAVAGYETSINGYDITNTLLPSEDLDEKEDLDVDSGEQEKGEGEQMPKTATNLFNFIALGLGILTLGITLLFFTRRKRIQ